MSRSSTSFDGAKSPWWEISAVVGDREISGYWSTSRRMVYVRSAAGSAATQQGGMPAKTLAAMLLREIATGSADKA
jgi:hypothetical protein